MWEDFWVRFSRRGVRVSEKISEVRFLYGNPGRHAQAHTNHKPGFVELHVLSRFEILENMSFFTYLAYAHRANKS